MSEPTVLTDAEFHEAHEFDDLPLGSCVWFLLWPMRKGILALVIVFVLGLLLKAAF